MSAGIVEADEAARGSRSDTYRNILMGVLTVAAIAAVGLLGTLTFYVVTDHRAAEAKADEIDMSAMKKQVTDGLQNMIDTNDSTKNFHIHYGSDLALFQVVPNGTEYRGLVTAQTRKGTNIPVEVTVYANTQSFMYEVDPGSSLRLTQTAQDEQQQQCNGLGGC